MGGKRVQPESFPVLEELLRNRLDEHIASGGLITAPDKLKHSLLAAIGFWLQNHAAFYTRVDREDIADAIRALQLAHMRKAKP